MGDLLTTCPSGNEPAKQKNCPNFRLSRYKRKGFCFYYREDGTDHCDRLPPKKADDNVSEEGWAPSYRYRNNPS